MVKECNSILGYVKFGDRVFTKRNVVKVFLIDGIGSMVGRIKDINSFGITLDMSKEYSSKVEEVKLSNISKIIDYK